MELTDLNPEFVRKNKEALESQGIEIPESLLTSSLDEADNRRAKLEKDLQTQIEDWLRIHGYYRRSPADLALLPKPKRGWFLHFPKTKKNPIVLDIILLHNTGYYTEFDIKLPPLRWSSDEQRTLCETYDKPVFMSFEAVERHVLEWENRIDREGTSVQ